VRRVRGNSHPYRDLSSVTPAISAIFSQLLRKRPASHR
jgi:hypothetical protein